MRKFLILVLILSFSTACVSTQPGNPYLVLIDKPEFDQKGLSVVEVSQNLKEAKEILPNVPAIANCDYPNCLMCSFVDMENQKLEKDFILLHGGKIFGHKNGFVINTQGMACSAHPRKGKTRLEQFGIAEYHHSKKKYDDILGEKSRSLLVKYIAYNKVTNLVAVLYVNHFAYQNTVCRYDFSSCYSKGDPFETNLYHVRIYTPSEKLAEQLKNFDLNNMKQENLISASYFTLKSLKDTSFKAHLPQELLLLLLVGNIQNGYKDADENVYRRFSTYYEIEKQNSKPDKDPNLMYKFLVEFMNARR